MAGILRLDEIHNSLGIPCASLTSSGGFTFPNGFSLPVLTNQQRDAISNISAGAIIFNSDNAQIQFYDGSDWKGLNGSSVGLGSSADQPAASAAEAYAGGLTSGNSAWITIGNQAYLMEYDPTDRFGTGDSGWVKFDNNFFGLNYQTIPYLKYGSTSTIQPAFNNISSTSVTDDTISSGTHRIGREQTHGGGNSLSTIRIQLPFFQKAQYAASYQGGGSDTADFGAFTQNFTGIINNTPYEDNGSGYWAVLWSGTSGNWTNDMLIVDPGNLGSGNNAHTANTGVLSYSTQRGTTANPPYIIWGTTDAYNEYRYTNSWTLWLH